LENDKGLKEKTIELRLDGMSCVNCAAGIDKFLNKNGLEDVSVNFAAQSARFRAKDGTDVQKIIKGIEGLGFSASEKGQDVDGLDGHGHDHSNSASLWTPLLKKFLFAALFTIPLLLAMIPGLHQLQDPIVQLVLCIPVMILGWYHFGLSAWRSLRLGILNMDVLIVLGSTAAFIYSLTGFVLGLGNDFLFFETAASIITLVLFGNYLEHRSVMQTTTAMRELTALQPKKAHLISGEMDSKNWNIQDVPVVGIRTGQVFLVNGGEQVPTDGQIVWGSGEFDESIMTGESDLVDKGIGEELLGGTWLAGGSVHMMATQVGKNTALAQIIELVAQAQNDKPTLQRMADRVSAIFVPLVLCVALATFLFNFYFFEVGLQDSLLRSIAVLVVACPCAMGLATPTAVMVGVGRAARNGILLKGASVIETLARAKNVVFDKTGTLTTGRFNIDSARSAIDRETFRGILLTLEQHSSHPLAKSIVKELKGQKPFPMQEVKEMKGLGVMGKDGDGNTYAAGSYKLVTDLTDDDSHNIYVIRNRELLGWIDLTDELKSNALNTVQSLRAAGLNLHLLSGDKEDKTQPIAEQLGLKNWQAGKLPQEKLSRIEELRKTGITVMVGDGVNDAPALAKADVGISLSDASQVAIQTADVVLLNGEMKNLPDAIKISKATLRTIKQNLFWAFFYNILMIPLAAVGILNPMIAALAMALSDVVVIGNSIRLRGRKL